MISNKCIITPLLIMSILLPPINLPTGIPDVRLEILFVLSIWGFLILNHFVTRKPIRFHRNSVSKWFLLFGLAIFASICYSALIKGYYPIGRDFWEFGKLIGYFLIFTLVANLNILPTEIEYYYRVTLIIFLCSSLFAYAQYSNFANINEVISVYYVSPYQMENVLQGRVTGTTGNPNEFGAFMILASLLAFSGIFFLKKKLFYLTCFIIFVYTIILTSSRTSMAALAVSICFIFFFKVLAHIRYRKYFGKFLIITTTVVIIISFIINFLPLKYIDRFSTIVNFADTPSWKGKVIAWKINYELWKHSPIFGWGPGKSMLLGSVDNEWLLILRRYGFVGLFIFIIWWVSFYLEISKIGSHSSNEGTTALIVALQATLISYSIFMIPAVIYHLLQLMPILLTFLGLAFSQMQVKGGSWS